MVDSLFSILPALVRKVGKYDVPALPCTRPEQVLIPDYPSRPDFLAGTKL